MSSNPYQTRDENRLRVAIREEQIGVAPANEVSIQIAVINDGPTEDDVNILIKGLPTEWTSIDLPVVHLEPGMTRQVIVTVQPPPVPESRVGQYPVEIHAVSRSEWKSGNLYDEPEWRRSHQHHR